jgi:putative tryptophan/tyrosine transport system substrate-binding protein
VGLGLVESLAQPGENITGLALLAQGDLEGKRLERLQETVPGLARVAFLVNWGSGNWLAGPDQERSIQEALQEAARALRLDVQTVAVSRPDDLAEAFAAMARAEVGALLVAADPHVLEPHLAQVVAWARTHRLPAIYPWRLYVEAGGLMAYATSIPAFHRQSAVFVDKIPKGAKPADLPVDQPMTFELVINLKTAQALGLTIPPALLFQADEVIR